MKAVLIGKRESLSKVQEKLLDKLGIEIVAEVPKADENTIRIARDAGAEAVIIKYLPLQVLIDFFRECKEAGLRLLKLETKAVALIDTNGNIEEAEKRAEELGADIVSSAPEGTFRLLRSTGISEITEAEFSAEPVNPSGRALLIGRHRLTWKQKELTKDVQFVGQVPHVNSVVEIIQEAQRLNAEAVLIQALPLGMIQELLKMLEKSEQEQESEKQQKQLKVWRFNVELIKQGLPTKEKAEELAKETEADIITRSKDGTWTVKKTTEVQRVKSIRIQKKPLITVE